MVSAPKFKMSSRLRQFAITFLSNIQQVVGLSLTLPSWTEILWIFFYKECGENQVLFCLTVEIMRQTLQSLHQLEKHSWENHTKPDRSQAGVQYKAFNGISYSWCSGCYSKVFIAPGRDMPPFTTCAHVNLNPCTQGLWAKERYLLPRWWQWRLLVFKKPDVTLCGQTHICT